MLTQRRAQFLSLVFASLTFLSLACTDKGQGIRETAAELLEEAADKLGDKSATTNTPRVTPTSTPHKAIPGLPAHKGLLPKAEITAIELTQGIQNLANKMPLIQDRMTYARVYVKAVNTHRGNDLPGVMGELCGFRDGEQIGECLLPENDGPIIAKTGGGDRLHLDDSFYFFVPPDWRKGNVTFKASIWNAADVLWNGKQTDVTFQKMPPLNILFFPIHVHKRNPTFWVLDDAQSGFETLVEGGRGFGKDDWSASIAFGNFDPKSGNQEAGVAKRSNKYSKAVVFGLSSSDEYEELMNIGVGKDNWGENIWAKDIAFGNIDDDDGDEMVVVRHVTQEGKVRLVAYDDKGGSKSPIFQCFASWGPGTHPTAVALGNVDDDEELEIAVVRKANNEQQPRLIVLDSPHSGDPEDDCEVLATGLHWGPGRNPTDVAFGDVDGDGRDEIGVSRKWEAADVGDPRYVILKYNEQTKQLDPLKEGYKEWGEGAWATSIAFGDVDGDGRDEIGITRHAKGNDRWFIVDDAKNGFKEMMTGGEYGPGTKSGIAKRHATAIAFGNIDDDVADEFGVVRKAMQGEPRVTIYDDASKNYVKLFEGFEWGEDYDPTNIAFGDVDGDGLDEVGISRKYTGWGAEKHYKWNSETHLITDHLYRYFPVADVNTFHTDTLIKPLSHALGGEWVVPDDFSWMLTSLAVFGAFTIDNIDNLHYSGMIDPYFFGMRTISPGMAMPWSSVAIYLDYADKERPWIWPGGETLAHEIGHSSWVKHPNCEGTEIKGVLLELEMFIDDEYPYPYPNCQLAAVDPEGYYGFDVHWSLVPDVSEPTVITNDPSGPPLNTGFPFIAYKNPKWIDPYTYCKLMPMPIKGGLDDDPLCNVDEISP